jgi:DNA-binding GntR family transcriptional regulator
MTSLQSLEASIDLSERVYQRLREAISNGELPPHRRLTQEELAESLNVSRQPVLQALRLLKQDGFVVDAGRRGLMVAPLEPQAVLHLYEVRAVLDGLAARLAAERRSRLDVSVIDAGRSAAAGTRVPPMIDADMRFHDSIYAASGNPLIGETAHKHWHHVRRAMGAVLRNAAIGHAVWDEHLAIIAAINRGDAAEAEQLARQHCQNAGRALSEQLSQHLQAMPSLRRSKS